MKIKIFVSYSHEDRRYLAKDSLLGRLKGLEAEGVEFWCDKDIRTGEKWDEEIKAKIEETHIALVLVSEPFLDSNYVKNVEMISFLKRCETKGLVIFPILLAPCAWKDHEWLKNLQHLPREGKTVVDLYQNRAKREKLFYDIRQDLKEKIKYIRQTYEEAPKILDTPGATEAPGPQKKRRKKVDEPSAHIEDGKSRGVDPKEYDKAMNKIRTILMNYIPKLQSKFPLDLGGIINEAAKENAFKIRPARAIIFGHTGVGKTTTINKLLGAFGDSDVP